jgi:branched-subunit amino acid transport protein AzlD
MSLNLVLLAILISTLIIFSLRAFPFILFSKREPPEIVRFIEKYIPPMVMAVLVIYCLKDIHIESKPYGIPELVAIAATVVLHLWKKNSMISIFGGTILFMVIDKLM